MNYDKLFISFLLKLILVLFLFNINLTNAFVIDTTGENNCNRIDTVDLGNGYSLKHYTLSATSIRNVGRTELYYNGELKEYQDNIFYSNGFVMRWYTGGSCIVHSLISSVEMVDNTVKISYDYFNPQSYSSTTRAYYNSKPIYFELGNKNITDINVSVYAFGYAPYFYVKLNLNDSNIDSYINIASQGFFENILNLGGASAGTTLSSAKRYGVYGCNVDNVTQDSDNYEINYTCNVYWYKDSSAINGPARTIKGTKVGKFILSKEEYNLCEYDENLCKENIPTISKLTQQIQSPNPGGEPLDKEYIDIGTSVGKFQSGSGVILGASITDEVENEYNLVFEIYSSGSIQALKTLETTFSSTGTYEVIVPYLGAGDYFWRAGVKSIDSEVEEWKEFGENLYGYTDYSIFEGFEPYPYGYSFYNKGAADGVLNGGVNHYVDTEFPYYHIDYIPGNKWDMFNNAFDTSAGSGFEPGSLKALLAFETLGLNSDLKFQGGNCYGMSLSSTLQYTHSDYLSDYFSEFSEQIGDGTIRNNINSPSKSSTGAWDIYNSTLNTILTLQLGQYSSHQRELIENSISNPQEIVTKLSNNPNNTYLLLFEGEDSYGNESGHAVVAYKVESISYGYRIYIWDNNIPHPYYEDKNGRKYYGYNQYIEINNDGNWFVESYERQKFTKLHLINIDDIYNLGEKSVPAGFMGIDFLYTLSGSLDMIIKDPEGRVSGFLGGTILEEIPGVDVIVPLNASLTGTLENTWKQIYIPEKIDGLTININGKESKSYDLMIAGGDYYTKISNVETSSGQTDIYTISRENIQLDFDDSKTGTGTYSILVDDFQNNGTGTIYTGELKNQIGIQTLDIDWEQVETNGNEAVVYTADIDNDGEIDLEKTTSAIENPEDTKNQKSSISGQINILEDYLIPEQKDNRNNNKNLDKLKYLDIILMLEKQKDEKEEKQEKKKEKENKNNKKDKFKEIFIKRQHIKIQEDGTFSLDKIEPGTYKLKILDNKLHQIVTPETGYYMLEIKDGYNYVNRDFEIIKNYKLKDVKENLENIKDKLNNLKHK